MNFHLILSVAVGAVAAVFLFPLFFGTSKDCSDLLNRIGKGFFSVSGLLPERPSDFYMGMLKFFIYFICVYSIANCLYLLLSNM